MESPSRLLGSLMFVIGPLACGDAPSIAAGSSSSSSSDASPSTTTASATDPSGDDVMSTATTDGASSSSGTTAASDTTSSSTTTAADTGEVTPACEDLGNVLPLSVMGTTATAANNATVVGPHCQLAWADGNDATYLWSAPAAGWYRFTAASPTSQSKVPLSLFDGCGGEPMGCEWQDGPEWSSTLAAELEADQTVMIAIDAMFTENEAPFELTIEPFTECGPAIDLGSELVSALPGDVSGQGDEVWAGCGYGGAMSLADVTYKWTAPQTGIYSVSATASGFAGSVTVYRGHCGNPSDIAACTETMGGEDGVHTSFPAQAGEELTFIVDAFSRTTTSAYELDIVFDSPLAGDCCGAHDTTGCEDFDTVACTCAVSSDCCNPEVGWPEACAGIAGSLCGACPPLAPGDCCDAHDSYGCSNAFVSACTCQITGGSCCGPEVFFAETWDDWCILNAEQYCNIDCP